MATVQRAGAEPVTGQSAAILLQQALGLGVAVPIEQMSLWIKGLPGDQAESVTYDQQNRLEKMNYRDTQGTLWKAKVLKYKLFDNVHVPATITLDTIAQNTIAQSLPFGGFGASKPKMLSYQSFKAVTIHRSFSPLFGDSHTQPRR